MGARLKKFFKKKSTPESSYLTDQQLGFIKGKEKFLEEFNIISVMKTL